jgi:probable phosphoglycerate mutase
MSEDGKLVAELRTSSRPTRPRSVEAVDRTTILLVRAARTAEDEGGRWLGRGDPDLDDQGREEARSLAAQLARRNPAAFVSGPLRRAAATADILAQATPAPASVSEAFTDVDLGDWTGCTVEEIARTDPSAFSWFFRFPRASEPANGEPLAEVERRVLDGLTLLGGAHAGRTIVVVTHELPIRLVLVRLRQLEGTALWDPDVPHCSVHEIAMTSRGLEVPTPLEAMFRSAATREARRWGDLLPPS